MEQSAVPFNLNGGLTLAAEKEYLPFLNGVKTALEEYSKGERRVYTPADIVELDFRKHNNGEPYLKLTNDHIGEHDVVLFTSGPGTHQMLDRLSLALWHLVGRRARRIMVITPYCPLARSDKDEGLDILALAAYPIQLMDFMGFGKLDRVVAFDLHSPSVVAAGHAVKPGFVTEVSMVRRLLQKAIVDARAINERICIDFPDEGAFKRFEGYYKQVKEALGFDLPKATGTKRRENSEKSEIEDVGGDKRKLKGSIVITLDDEIATGGTLIESAEQLKREYQVAQVWAAVTHGVFCGKAIERFSRTDCPVDRIYVTDTIPFDHRPELNPLFGEIGRLRLVSCIPDVAKIVYFGHNNGKIRTVR